MKTIYTLLIVLLSSVAAFAQVTYVWTMKTPPPFGTNGRTGADCFAINGKVYLAMGNDSGALNTYNELWEYDPATDVWTQKGVYPYQGSYGTSSFVINNEGYAFGGWWRLGPSTNQTIQSHYKYNPVTGIFTSVTAFPDANRYKGASFVINGKGYYGTGYAPDADDMWEYDASANTWTLKAPMPAIAREGAVGFAIGGYGYVGLGISWPSGPGPCYSDLWRFDPVANSWLQRTGFPGTVRALSSVMVLNNEAFLVGGTNFTGTAFDQVYKYNPVTDAWTFIGVFPGGPRHNMSATTTNGKGYIGQGEFGNPALSETFTHNDWWQFEVVTGVGINEAENENIFSISPNPVATELTLHLNTQTLPTSIFIFDIKGQLLFDMKPSSEKTTIDVSHFVPGNYIIETVSDKKIITTRFIKQ